MKSRHQIVADSVSSAADSACDVRPGCEEQGYFHRISRIIERGILLFVVSLTLLGNYVAHRQLMSEVLLS